MRRFKGKIPIFAAIGFVIVILAGGVLAQRVSEREIRDIVRSLNSRIDDFRLGLTYQMRSSSTETAEQNSVTGNIGTLQDKMRVFEENLNLRRENRDDVNDVLSAAYEINAYIESSQQNQRITSDWEGVRGLLDRLSANYGVTPNWTAENGRVEHVVLRRGTVSAGLSGTYRLDVSASDSTSEILANAGVSGSQRQDLEAKLVAPEEIAIDVRGNRVVFASSNTTPTTYVADGSEKADQNGGRTIRVRSTLSENEFSVSHFDNDSDFTVSYASIESGRKLKATRRITTNYLNETLLVDSVYVKSDAVAGLGIGSVPDDNAGYSSNDPSDIPVSAGPGPGIVNGRSGEFIVPNGTIVTGLLESEINTKLSQNNDRFKMTVQSPVEYRGAVIEGYISGVGRSGRSTGSSNVTFNFDRITLRDGRSFDFAGSLQAVRDQNGRDIKVDAEGAAKGSSQTRKTAKRGIGGAGLGAIIGAIAGGGSGAAIGAIIGGSTGAGSVLIGGREDIRLMPGSTLTVESSSPIKSGQQPDN